MSWHIYILTDGINTKIGITSNLDNRLSAYKTHNPNFFTYRVFDCDKDQAKKIESVIKLYFKDKLTGPSKEWFSVSAEEINGIVSALIYNYSAADNNLAPGMHEVKLTEKAEDHLQALIEARTNSRRSIPEQSIQLRNEMAEIFAQSFKLGIPKHRLPQDIVQRDNFGIDIYTCDKKSPAVQRAARNKLVSIPNDDHIVNFYHLAKLSTSSYVAFCSSRVTMPYIESTTGIAPEILNAANSYGLHAFEHDHWSWHRPNETGLILFTQKTPIQKRLSMWESSFRKWVIERSKLLGLEQVRSQEEHETLRMTISDICIDNSFPLHVKSVEELYVDYLDPFFGISWNSDHFMKRCYQLLFKKWSDSQTPSKSQ